MPKCLAELLSSFKGKKKKKPNSTSTAYKLTCLITLVEFVQKLKCIEPG